MTFKDLKIKKSYSSEKDNILEDFYIPVLSEAINYKRIAGYFSSSSFYMAAKGISKFIDNAGHMQLIINVQLSKRDYEQIEKSLSTPEEIIENLIFEDISDIADACLKDHAAVLGWMIANGFLEIKVGYIKNPLTSNDILHQKVGILKDLDGNILTFSGSNNESAGGWIFNSEKFKVFCDWEEGSEDYINQDIEDFQELWNNDSSKTGVISFPEAAKRKLISIAPKKERELKKILEKIKSRELNDEKKRETKTVNLRGYQKEAIQKWFDNDCKGLFEMATGTGKTYAAIGALKKILNKEESLLTIISCPFLHLIPQWEDSLIKSSVDLPKILASSIDLKWAQKLKDKILDIKLGRLKKFIILTTHNTLSSEKFIEIVKEAPCKILLIGDEVHGMGSSNRIMGLLDKYNYRLGLSATPHRYFDDEGTQKLMDFFKRSVYTFDLERAINEINPDTGESYLCPYEYYPIFVDLTLSELDEYIKLSKQLSSLFAREKRTKREEKIIESKLRERADIIKNAENKLPSFTDLIKKLKNKQKIKHTLVYCSPQQKTMIQDIIRKEGKIIQHRFTSDENATRKQAKYGGLTEREYLLNKFDKGLYDILVAIKCLDEGVDVPSIETAILMSSTGNPKEYIQRRGRVLRRYPGKEKAVIYDLIVIPNTKNKDMGEYERKIMESQFKRIEEFVNQSLNYSDASRNLFKIKIKYNILSEKQK